MCRQLKQRAAAALEDWTWHDVYHLVALRGGSGAVAWLFHTYGEPWRLYHSPDRQDGAECGDLIQTFSDTRALGLEHLRPESTEVARRMQEGSERFRDKEREVKTGWW